MLAALAVSARAGRKQNLVGVYLRPVHPTANTPHQAGPSPSGADLNEVLHNAHVALSPKVEGIHSILKRARVGETITLQSSPPAL